MTQHPFHIFECLRSLNNILFPPIRDFSVYEKFLYIDELVCGRYGKFFAMQDWPYWLSVSRPDFDVFPKIPSELADWVADWGGQTPGQPPQVKKYARRNDCFWQAGQSDFLSATTPGSLDGERFDSNPERVGKWQKWLGTQWLPWAKENLERFAASEAYEQLWFLFKQLERSPGQFELVWCDAVLLWQKDDVQIRHPLLGNRLEIEYMPQQGIFNLLSTSAGPRLEYDMLFGLPELDLQKLFLLERQLLEQPLDLRDKTALTEFCGELGKVISSDCQVLLGQDVKERAIGEQPCICCGQPFVLLRRLDGSKWRGELASVVDAIDSGAVIADLFSYYYRNGKKTQELPERSWQDSLVTPLFPWAGASAQWEAMRRLSDKPLVVVQAPPASDKEKFIANMLVHLLAHGKRVLVTGGAGACLQQVNDLLNRDFPEIAPLCVGAAGTDRENIDELLTCLRAHNQKMNFYTREEISRELADLQKRLGQCRNELAEDKSHLQAALELEHTRRFNLLGKEKFPWEIAKWLEENREQLGYIPDLIGHDEACPLSSLEMDRFFELVGRISLLAGKELALWRPPVDKLLTDKQLADLVEQLDGLLAVEDMRQELLADCLFKETDSVTARGLLSEYQQALADLPGIEGDWLQSVIRDVCSTVQRRKVWEDLYHTSSSRLQKIRNLQNVVNQHEISFPTGIDYRQLRDALYNLRIEFYKNNKLSLVFKLTAGKKTLGIFQECLLDGLLPGGVEDIDLILAKVDYLDEIRKLTARWNNTVFEVQGPRLDEFEPGLLDSLERYLAQIKQTMLWRRKYLEVLQASWDNFSHNQLPQFAERQWLLKMLPKVQAWCQQRQIEELKARLRRQNTLLTGGAAADELHPVCWALTDALRDKDMVAWQLGYQKVVELQEQQLLWNELYSLYVKIADVAPLWAELLAASGEQPFALAPKAWQQAWQWRQACAWLKRHVEGNRVTEIAERFCSKLAEEKELVKKVADTSAWYWQLRRVTAEEKRGLDFLLSKADQKYGDSAEELSREFLREAEFWRLSLPAWVIPVDLLLETAGTFDRLFDVVIVDDAQKCDIFTLCLLLRGKKAVVIGDSMLPGCAEFTQGKAAARLLLEKSLLGIPTKARFELHDSLYDFALRLQEGQYTLLNEQLATPLGIGSFSNEHFYGKKLSLLPKPCEPLVVEAGLTSFLVEPFELAGKSNQVEAEFMLDNLVRLLADPAYEQKSFCLLTLGDGCQQKILEELLFLRVAEEQIAKHQLVCASAEDYVAGQRDVVLLSLVSAKVADKADPRVVNAALSVARDKLLLFQPFDSGSIFPRSVVGRLLLRNEQEQGACLPVQEAFASYSSPLLLQDVWQMISDRGYRAIPEYQVDSLACRLDIVVSGTNGKVAVLCDGLRGRADLARLAVQKEQLTRLGWQFWHLRGCDFYADKEGALAGLWQLLDDLGIVTVQEESFVRAY